MKTTFDLWKTSFHLHKEYIIACSVRTKINWKDSFKTRPSDSEKSLKSRKLKGNRQQITTGTRDEEKWRSWGQKKVIWPLWVSRRHKKRSIWLILMCLRIKEKSHGTAVEFLGRNRIAGEIWVWGVRGENSRLYRSGEKIPGFARGRNGTESVAPPHCPLSSVPGSVLTPQAKDLNSVSIHLPDSALRNHKALSTWRW